MNYRVTFAKCSCVVLAAQLFAGYSLAAEPAVDKNAVVAKTANKAKDIKMYTVDMSVVYENFYKAKEARESLEAEAKSAQAEVEKMMNDGKKIIESLQALEKKIENPAVDAAAKAKIEDELREKGRTLHELEIQINSFRHENDERLNQKQQSILAEHFNEIKQHITALAKRKSAHFVFNSAGIGVLYAKDAYDITQEVIELVNKGSVKK